MEAQRAEALDRAADPARAPIERATAERQAQDLDREPQPKLGAATVAMERQGIQTDRGDQWRDVQARNAERQGLWQQVREWGSQIVVQAREKAMEVAERLREAAEWLVPSPALAGGLDRLRAAGETMAQERAMADRLRQAGEALQREREQQERQRQEAQRRQQDQQREQQTRQPSLGRNGPGWSR